MVKLLVLGVMTADFSGKETIETMYAKLCKGIKLRGYMFVPQCFYYRYSRHAQKLTEDELSLLKQCDGKTEIEDSELLQNLIKRRIAEVCKQGDINESWQEYHYYENRYFPSAKIAITGKCCFNCRHCFNSASLDTETTEFSRDELLKLVADLDDCGIHSLQITGGEPLLHPSLNDTLREIAKRGMHLFEFITTGHFLTAELLDLFIELGLKPQFKLSYDGIGHHDWFRKSKGAEKRVLESIRLLKEKGFGVRVHMQAYKGNIDTWLKTALLCDDLGVDEIQLIRTFEVPRTIGSEIRDEVLTIDEYYEYGLNLIREYIEAGGKNIIDMWQFIRVMPKDKRYGLRTAYCEPSDYRDNRPICGMARAMIQIDFDGEVWPCLPIGGFCKAKNIRYGNVKEQSIGELITFSDFIDILDISVAERRKHNAECQICEYFKACAGGCPALGILFSNGDYLAKDAMKCVFWKKHFTKTVEMFNKLGYLPAQDLSGIPKTPAGEEDGT